ncbi:MAG: hypothetical protein IJC19_06430, partial [Clostridia bacterium]|nr:hypothetical protein [Clostridia bacterium]
ELKGDRLACKVTETEGRDGAYRALAVKDGEEIDLLCVNPISDTVPCEVKIEGLKNGTYRIDAYHCTETINNCVTGTGDGSFSLTKTKEKTVTNGTLKHQIPLENNHFVLFRIKRADEA